MITVEPFRAALSLEITPQPRYTDEQFIFPDTPEPPFEDAPSVVRFIMKDGVLNFTLEAAGINRGLSGFPVNTREIVRDGVRSGVIRPEDAEQCEKDLRANGMLFQRGAYTANSADWVLRIPHEEFMPMPLSCVGAVAKTESIDLMKPTERVSLFCGLPLTIVIALGIGLNLYSRRYKKTQERPTAPAPATQGTAPKETPPAPQTAAPAAQPAQKSSGKARDAARKAAGFPEKPGKPKTDLGKLLK